MQDLRFWKAKSRGYDDEEKNVLGCGEFRSILILTPPSLQARHIGTWWNITKLCFVGGKLTDLFSYYTLPSTVIGNPTYDSLKAAFCYYMVPNTESLEKLMSNALIVANSKWVLKLFMKYNSLSNVRTKDVAFWAQHSILSCKHDEY